MNALCPTQQQLISLSQGLLSQEMSDTLLYHIKDCDTCLNELVELDSKSDTLIQQLKAATDQPEFENEAGFKNASQRALAALSMGQSMDELATSPPPKEIGEYVIVRPLGHGGMGNVYLGQHTKLGREVAIKLIADHRRWDETMQARFASEMKLIGGLNHPNIVTAHDAREVDGVAALVTEYIDGLTVSEILKSRGRLSVRQTARITAEICRALAYINSKGMIHRDIKPSNVMIDRSGTVKLLDLGLARLQSPEAESGLTATHQPIGTADYIAPELIDGSGKVDIRADLYSLGCMLYKMLTGQAPFANEKYSTSYAKLNAHVHEPAKPIARRVKNLPEALAAVIDQMLEKDPEQRPRSAKEVFERVKPFCDKANLARLVEQAGQPQTIMASVVVPSGSTAAISAAPVNEAGVPSPNSPFPLDTPNAPIGLPPRTSPYHSEPATASQIEQKSRAPLWILLGVIGFVTIAAAGVLTMMLLMRSPAVAKNDDGVELPSAAQTDLNETEDTSLNGASDVPETSPEETIEENPKSEAKSDPIGDTESNSSSDPTASATDDPSVVQAKNDQPKSGQSIASDAQEGARVYGFGAGRKYEYQFRVEVELGDSKKRNISGVISYNIAKKDPRNLDQWDLGNLMDNAEDDQNLIMMSYSGLINEMDSRGHEYVRGDMICDDTGQVVGTRVSETPGLESGDSMVRYLFEPLEELPLMDFPDDGKSQWKEQCDLCLSLLSTEERERNRFSRRSPLDAYRMNRLLPGYAKQVQYKVESITIDRKYEYETVSETDEEIIFIRKLNGTPREKGDIYVELEREDKITFDKKENIISKIRSRGETKLTGSNVTVTLPLNYELDLKKAHTVEEVAAADKARKDRAARVDKLRNAPTGKTAQLNPDLVAAGIETAESFQFGLLPLERLSTSTFEFSPDGQFLVCVGTSGKLAVFDTTSKRRVELVENLQLGTPSCIEISPDGKHCLLGGHNGTIEVFTMSSAGNLEHTGQFKGHSKEVKSMAVDPSGQYVISGSEKVAVLWKLKDLKKVNTFEGFTRRVEGTAFMKEGSWAVACCQENIAYIDVESGALVRMQETYRSRSAGDIAFSDDGKRFAVSEGSSVEVYQTDTLKRLGTLKGKGVTWVLRFLPDGKHLLTGASNLSLWDIDSFEHVQDFDVSQSYVQEIAVSGDGRFFAGINKHASGDISVLVNPTSNPDLVAEIQRKKANTPKRILARIKTEAYSADSLCFSPDGKYLYLGSRDLSVIDVEEKKEIQKLSRLEAGRATEIVVTSDGKKVLVGTYSGKVIVYDRRSNGKLKESGQFVGHSSKITALAVGPKNKFVVSGERNRARIWNLKNLKEGLSLEFKHEVKACRILPTGKAAVISDSNNISVVMLSKLKVWKEFNQVVQFSSGEAAISPDGTNVVVQESSKLSFIDAKSGTNDGSIEASYSSGPLVYHPNGKHLLRFDRSKIQIIDVKQQEEVGSIRLDGNRTASAMAISADGTRVALFGGLRELVIYNYPISDQSAQ